MTSKSPLVDTLAQNLRYFRQQLGISQEEFADICHLHRTYIGSVERCERNITLKTLETLAKGLGVTVCDLLTIRNE
jgi:transcriptional regulator with XRE-family HTH domain